MRILLTGATGFLGRHIAEACIKAGHDVLGTYRHTSTRPEIIGMRWTETDDPQFEANVAAFAPQVLIHAAWGGVDAGGRNDEAIQNANITLTQHCYHLAPFEQIIVLGSQDEYGYLDNIVTEAHPCQPLSAYARAKAECLNLLKAHIEAHPNVGWIWLRLFSLYGPGQTTQWLIPSVVDKCLSGAPEMLTTPGEQVYSYLHVHDLANAIVLTLGKCDRSGIYNISSAHPYRLRDLFATIAHLSGSAIRFNRSLPYRPNQSMLMIGSSQKFIDTFGEFEETSLENGLNEIIHLYKSSHTDDK